MELVSAVNNMEMFAAAQESPADAIYVPIAGLVAIRWARDFFSLSQLPELIAKAHTACKKIYPVINGHITPSQWVTYKQAARKIYHLGADGVVVGSVELIKFIREDMSPYPGFKVIASSSVQAINTEDFNLLAKLGAERIIISRLHSLGEIEALGQNTATELELFVHGLLCPCWEGYDCLLPLLTYGKQSDWGSCLSLSPTEAKALPCTQYYAAQGAALWQMRIQCDVELVPRLIEYGISSFKVIPPAKDIAGWQRTLSIWREVLEHAQAGHIAPNIKTLKEELVQLAPWPVDFGLRSRND